VDEILTHRYITIRTISFMKLVVTDDMGYDTATNYANL